MRSGGRAAEDVTLLDGETQRDPGKKSEEAPRHHFQCDVAEHMPSMLFGTSGPFITLAGQDLNNIKIDAAINWKNAGIN